MVYFVKKKCLEVVKTTYIVFMKDNVVMVRMHLIFVYLLC